MKIITNINFFDSPGVGYFMKNQNRESESGQDADGASAGYDIMKRENLRFIPDELVRKIDYHLLNPYFARISEQFPIDEQYELDKKTRNREQVFDVEGYEKA